MITVKGRASSSRLHSPTFVHLQDIQAFSSLARHNPDLIEDNVVRKMAEEYGTTVPVIIFSCFRLF